MAYRVATNADNVEFNNGPLSGYTFGGYTAAMLVKRNTLGGRQGALFIVSSGFSFPHFEFGFELGASNAAGLFAGSSGVTGPVVGSTSLWYLIVVTGTGTGTPRFHVHDGTSWSHTNASGALAPLASIVSTDRHFLSPPSAWGGDYLKADVVCQGIKKADSTDLAVQALTPTAFSSWQAFGFDWLVGFDASGTRTNQGSGTGGNEIARTGTSLVADPAGWTWAAPAPVADFTGTPLSGAAPLSVTFTDASTNTPTSWAWTFGDGGTSTSQNPTHSYAAPGTYTVALVATNAGGSNTKTRTGYVTVQSGFVPQIVIVDG